MQRKVMANIGGGATPLSTVSKGFDGIGLVKILRYYGTKILRSNIRHSKPEQYSCVRREPVILNCLRQDNTLNIGGTYHVILNLFQDLAVVTQRKPRPRISNTRKLVLKFNPRPQGVGVHPVSEAHSNHKPHATHLTHATHVNQETLKQVQGDKNVSEVHSKFLVPYCLSNLVSSKKTAFTLAEVLITLAIIGVVAAMTIPTLISNYQEKATVSKVKQAFSIISQAYQLAKIENGEFGTWGFKGASSYGQDDDGQNVISADSAENMKIFWQKLSPYLKVASSCYYDDSSCQFPVDKIYMLAGSEKNIDEANYSSLSLANGMTFLGGWINDPACRNSNVICGDFGIDVNGLATAPNTLGRDIFYFYIYRDKIVPMGEKNFPYNCNIEDDGQSNNGYYCTFWVIQKGNMEYLKCNDLSINGKQKC